MGKYDAASFWFEGLAEKTTVGASRFKNIAEFALAMLTLPFSNAIVERVFSLMNVVKNKLRNRMQCEMLDSILMVRSGLDWRGETCRKMEVTKEMLSKFNAGIYVTVNSESTEENNDIVELFDMFDS